MKRTLTAMEARRKFGEMLEDVRRGDEVVIERAGKTMGVLISPERYQMIERRRAEALKTLEEIQAEVRARTKNIPAAEIDRMVGEAVREVRGKGRARRRSA
jgi:prevent-host-death family protein